MRDEARRTSFDRNAEQYDAARPSYPDAIVDGVLAHTGARRLLEVGAGTGKATVRFAARSVSIVALEPGDKMAARLRANTGGSVTVVETRFEDYVPDETFDLVYAAQAWHWIDPARRYELAARAARWLAILTNEKAPVEPVTLRDELDAAYRRHMPDAEAPRDLDTRRRGWIAEVDASGRFESVHLIEHAWSARYTTRRYLDLIDTFSDHAVLPEKAPLYTAIAAALDRHGGAIEIPYVTMAFVAQRR